MSQLDAQLERFAKRVRLLRALKGVALGATVGGFLSIAQAVLDYTRVFYTEWVWLAVPLAAGAVVGGILGWLRKPSAQDVAESLDRRANLRERLSTAHEEHVESLADLQREDAESHLDGLKPAQFYPWRLNAWHLGPILTAGAAAFIFLAATGAILQSPASKSEKAELAKKGKEIEKVVKPLVEEQPGMTAEEEKALATRMEKFARDLQKGRVPKEEAMRTENELAEQLRELTQKRFEQSNQSLAEANASLEKMALEMAQNEGKITAAQAQKLEQAIEQSKKQSQENNSGSGEDQMAADMRRLSSELSTGRKSDGREMTAEEKALAESQMRDLQDRMSEMESALKEMQKMAESGKDAQGNQLSKAELDALKKRMEELSKLLENVKLSQELQDWMKKLNSMPEMEELREMMRKMAENNQQQQQNPGEPPKLTPEDIQKMIERMEEMAKKFKDDEAMRELIKQLIEAAKKGGGACKNGMCMGLLPGLGLMPGMMNMPSGPGMDRNYTGVGIPPLSKEGTEVKNAKTQTAPTRGDRRPEGEMTFVEVRGPTGVGERTRTPYTRVLPQYKKQAEKALEKEAVPAQHRKRVKDYFDSLQGGGGK